MRNKVVHKKSEIDYNQDNIKGGSCKKHSSEQQRMQCEGLMKRICISHCVLVNAFCNCIGSVGSYTQWN